MKRAHKIQEVLKHNPDSIGAIRSAIRHGNIEWRYDMFLYGHEYNFIGYLNLERHALEVLFMRDGSLHQASGDTPEERNRLYREAIQAYSVASAFITKCIDTARREHLPLEVVFFEADINDPSRPGFYDHLAARVAQRYGGETARELRGARMCYFIYLFT